MRSPAIKPQPIAYAHPLSDPLFAGEQLEARDEVLIWWNAFTAIDDAASKKKEIGKQAVLLREKPSTVKNKYYLWKGDGRKWNGLVNRSKYPDLHNSALPSAFKQWVIGLYLDNQRDQTFRQTYRLVMQSLRNWERAPHNPELIIPGYTTPPQRDSYTHHPEGWSESNLSRLLPNIYERTLRRQGPKAASEYLPSLYTTRFGLAFFQMVYFDDQWFDNNVNVTGINAKAMRGQSFSALECLSGDLFDFGMRPQIWDDEKSKRSELNSLDFFWFVMHVLTHFGYNPETGTTLVFEHGSANVDKTGNFDAMLEAATGGKVKIARSGIWRSPALKAMLFEGKPTGNFRFKAPIESFFNLLRNYSAGLPAPTGRNPEHAPEESHGLLAYNTKLLNLIDEMPAERFLALKRPVPEWEDYTRMVHAIHRAINGRREHALEGWVKCGFTGQRYRLDPTSQLWMGEREYQMIPAQQRAALDYIVQQPGYHETFRLSPQEVFDANVHILRKLPIHLVPVLAPERAWEDIKVSDQMEMTIIDRTIDSEPLRYIAKIETQQGLESFLERGKTYKRLLNIFDPTMLWIAEANGKKVGSFLGTATRTYVPCKVDHESIVAAMGTHGHVRSLEGLAVKVTMESEAAQRLADRKHNNAIIGGAPATQQDRIVAADTKARVRKETGSMSDLLGAAPTREVMPEEDQDEEPAAPLSLKDLL